MPIDWNWDSYHHWQIAYYTLHVGLKHGRMWDLRGMEYVWGIVPHLIEAFLLWIFRTSSITPFRILNMLLGSISAFLVYLIGRDKFGWMAGLFSGVIVAVCSAFVVFDITGLGDTVATFFIIASIFLSRKRPFLSGVLLGLGCQSRIEFWGIAGLYFLFMYFYRRSKNEIRKIDYFFPKISGWLFIMISFSIFFYAKTRNPIYPFYYSVYNVAGGFIGPSAGRLFQQLLFSTIMNLFSPSYEYFYINIFFFSILLFSMVLYIVFLRKEKKYRNIDFYVFVLSIIVFRCIHFMVGSETWLILPFERLLMIRIFQIDIALGAILIFSLIINIYRYKHIIPIIIFLIILPISFYNTGTYFKFQEAQISYFKATDGLISIYKGGTITCDSPNMVYHLIHEGGVKHTNILSNLYSPLYYHSTPTTKQYLEWFVKNNITYIVYTGGGWSHQVYSYAQQNIPALLFQVGEYGSLRFMKVNQTALMDAVSKQMS